MKLFFLATLAVLSTVHAESIPSYTPADVASAHVRASTPFRPDRPVPATAIDPQTVDLAAMWTQARAADQRRGMDSSECQAFMLQYEFTLRLMPERAPLRDVFDALQLEQQCQITPPTMPASTAFFKPWTAAQLAAACKVGPFYVDAVHGSDSSGSGSKASPFKTVPHAINATRTARGAAGRPEATACVVLRGGTHFLGATQLLTSADSGLVITGYDGDAPAWISGGTPLGALAWEPFKTTDNQNVYVADVSHVGVTSMPGLQTLSATGAMPTRLFQAYFPNTFKVCDSLSRVYLCDRVFTPFLN